MSWMDKVKDALKSAKDISGILSVFRVPGAKTVSEAVEKIHLDGDRSNDDAVQLLAATVDAHEQRIAAQDKRIAALEKTVKALQAKK